MAKPDFARKYPSAILLEHWIVEILFVILALTGLARVLDFTPVGQTLAGIFGGMGTAQTLYNICAVVLIFAALIHLGFARYRVYIKPEPVKLVPSGEDMKAARMMTGYATGSSRQKPFESSYSIAEKTEYWLLAWITIILLVTGLISLNPQTFTTIFPLWLLSLVKLIHGIVIILAIIAAAWWFSFNQSAKKHVTKKYASDFTSQDFKSKHPLELVDKKNGYEPNAADPNAVVRFYKMDLPQYLFISGLTLALMFYFLNFDAGAHRQVVPPEDIIHTPVVAGDPVPVEEVPEPVEVMLSWDESISALLDPRCTACHGESAMGGLDLRTYETAMASGAIVAGDPDGSSFITLMESGAHPAVLEANEILMAREWIIRGAPQSEGDPFTLSPAVEEEEPEEIILAWNGSVAALFDPSCTACHGENAMGGLDCRTYESTMESGFITPGDPDESSIVSLMESGAHPAVLDEDSIAILRDWITAGAPENIGDEVVEEEEEPEMIHGLTWSGGIADIFAAGCTSCHGAMAMGGVDLSTYEAAMESGSIVSGNPSGSSLITLMDSGSHPALLTGDNLAKVRGWIADGAPAGDIEEPEEEEEEEEPEEVEEEAEPAMIHGLTWSDGIADIFAASCNSCHGAAAMGGVNLSSYETAMDSGAIVSGNPSGSSLITLMDSGSHPAVLSGDNLAKVRGWIADGAPAGVTEEVEEIEEVEEPVEEEPVEEEPVEEEPEPEEEPVAEEPAPGYTWTDIGAILGAGCGTCHGLNAMGGLDVSTYQTVMDSGTIVPGDPGQSALVVLMESGSHMATLAAEDLEKVRAWIAAGAPE